MANTLVPAETLPVLTATELVAVMPVPASPSGGQSGSTMEPDKNDVKGFDEFIERYKAGLAVERAAVDSYEN